MALGSTTCSNITVELPNFARCFTCGRIVSARVEPSSRTNILLYTFSSFPVSVCGTASLSCAANNTKVELCPRRRYSECYC